MDTLLIFVILLLIAIIIGLILKKKPKYGIETKTDKGETVRSKKEGSVANYLNSKNIDYEYEKEITVGKKKMLTDFYLPKYDIYVEYWGLDKLENKTGDEYRKRKAEKIELYDKGNLKLISIDEADLKDIDRVFPKKLQELIDGFGSSTKTGGLKSLLFGKEGEKSSHCTNCGEDISVGSEFCTSCGNKEKVYCNGCGEAYPHGTEFCSSCGKEI